MNPNIQDFQGTNIVEQFGVLISHPNLNIIYNNKLESESEYSLQLWTTPATSWADETSGARWGGRDSVHCVQCSAAPRNHNCYKPVLFPALKTAPWLPSSPSWPGPRGGRDLGGPTAPTSVCTRWSPSTGMGSTRPYTTGYNDKWQIWVCPLRLLWPGTAMRRGGGRSTCGAWWRRRRACRPGGGSRSWREHGPSTDPGPGGPRSSPVC